MSASPVLSPNRPVRCPICGTERLQRRSARDPIDRLYQTPSDRVRRLFASDMQLYHCRVCRLQFYDAGQPAEAADRKTAEAAPEKTERMAIAEPAAAVADDPTVIGETVTIMGRVSSREDILLNGEIDGGLDIPGHRLTIGASGRMRGDVLAAEVVALGTVEGNMDARQKLVIRASASMHGDIRSPSPTIEEGALFKGKIETA